jgi:hypothetical protein
LTDIRDIPLKWVSPFEPPNLEAATEQIYKELEQLVETGLDEPMDLIFHTVFLTENYSGPLITVAPDLDDNTIACYYEAFPDWEEFEPKQGDDENG